MSRPRRRSLAALAAPVALAALVLGTLAAALTPSGAAAADDTVSPIQVVLGALRPVAPQPGDTLVVSGTLHNTSDDTVSNLALELRLSPVVGTRGEFDQYAADPTGALYSTMLPITDPVPAEVTTLAPGASEPFALSLELDQSELDQLGLLSVWQVRELGIAVTGTIALETQSVGQLRTFLPWAPRDAVGNGKQVRLAWVWPLVDRPHRSASGVWFNDRLAPEISAGGRLSSLLGAGSAAEDQNPLGHNPRTANVPVTWAIDPMLVGDVNAMTAGYRVDAPHGTVAGTGTSAAKTWLANLRDAVTRTDAQVIALPYADPDVAAAVRAGLTTSIGVATAAGTALLQRTISGATLLPFGWPVDGLANQRTVNALRSSGDTALVLSDTALPVTGGPPSATPTARTVLTTNDGEVPVLLSDSGLDADVQGGLDDPNGSRLSLQRFLAETLMIQAELPGKQRDLVVTPPRRWSPSPTYAAALLSDTGRVPWILPVSLGAVRLSPLDSGVERDPLTYPPSARHAELSPDYLSQVNAVRSDISDFNAILPPGNPTVGSFTVAAQQTLSSAWRDQPVEAERQLDSLRTSVLAQMAQVHIASRPGSFVTLTSHGGKVPVTIENNLDVPVRVTVQLEANQRLTLSKNGRVTVPIPAREQTAVEVHAAAKTSGVFPLQVQLLTPTGTGRPYGKPVRLFVRSTVYGTITLAITVAAMVALLVAVGIRLTRRAMAARRASTAGDA